jgi:hypothetical protein
VRKNLSGKTEYCRHTRNTAVGKRGVNKAERKAPLPNEDEPAYKHRKKKTKSPPKPWLIEVDFGLFGRGWELFSSYETKEQRDQALQKHKLKCASIQFRAIDPIVVVQSQNSVQGAGTVPAEELGDIVRKPPSERA